MRGAKGTRFTVKIRVAKLVDIGRMELSEQTLTTSLQDSTCLVKMEAVGICGSDLHYYLHGGLGSFKQKMPMEMGHEPAGIVVESKSKRFKEGDRVAIEPGLSCGNKCKCCEKGRHNLCSSVKFMGATDLGAFRDYAILSDRQLEKIPDAMSFEEASLMEPIGIAVHCMNRVNPQIGDSITIFGAGMIGISALLVAKKVGIKKVIMVDPLNSRLEMAKNYGATETVIADEKCLDVIKDLTNGEGTSICIDAAGKAITINNCFSAASLGGKVAIMGIPSEDYVSLNPHKMRIKELDIINVRRNNLTLPQCVALFSEDRSIINLVTNNSELEDIQSSFESCVENPQAVLKHMINFK